MERMHSSVSAEIARLEIELLNAQLDLDHELAHEIAERIDDLLDEERAINAVELERTV